MALLTTYVTTRAAQFFRCAALVNGHTPQCRIYVALCDGYCSDSVWCTSQEDDDGLLRQRLQEIADQELDLAITSTLTAEEQAKNRLLRNNETGQIIRASEISKVVSSNVITGALTQTREASDRRIPLLLFDDVEAIIANDDGTDEEPTLGRLTNGFALFYLAATNSLLGATGSGKTYILMLAMIQEMKKGNTVLFLDYESSPKRIMRRLLALGATKDELVRHLRRARPERKFTEETKIELREVVERYRPTLVVIDSTGESLAVQGANPNADEEVARWFTLAPTYIASLGPGVVLVDHVAKGANGRWPIGSQRKLAAISGASYACESKVSFSQGKSGHSLLKVAKDREGFRALDEIAGALMVTVTVDETGSPAGTTFELVGNHEVSVTPVSLIKDRIISDLREHPGSSTKEIATRLDRDDKNTARDLRKLLDAGEVIRDETTRPHRWSASENTG